MLLTKINPLNILLTMLVFAILGIEARVTIFDIITVIIVVLSVVMTRLVKWQYR